jgi:hypothetical protein
MYRPNFCAECGERVERRRRLWASRRFCAQCARRFRRGRVLRPLGLSVVLVCLGFLLGRVGRTVAPPPLAGREALSLAPLAAGGAAKRAGEPLAGRNAQGARAEPSYGPDGSASERPTEPDEVVSICGARTRKGTPCQRRVRGTGRCWQHRGKAAMLPPSKLVVPN